MKIITNSLHEELESWSDPGDYPSNAGGGPLPSRLFVADVQGFVSVYVTKDELLCALNASTDLQSELDLMVELDYCTVDSWSATDIRSADDEDAGFVVEFVPFHWTDV